MHLPIHHMSVATQKELKSTTLKQIFSEITVKGFFLFFLT